MATAKLEGLHYEINGNEFKLFGYGAEIPGPKETTFLVQTFMGMPARVDIPPPELPAILETISADEAAGKFDKIEYVLLSALTAGLLLVQRVLAPGDFAEAEEEDLFHGKFGTCIVLPKKVKFGDHEFHLLVVDNDKKKNYPSYATLDKDGEIV